MRIVRLLVIGLFLALNASVAWAGGLSLKLTALDPDVKPGSKIMIRVTVTNVSNQLISFHDTRRDCDYSVTVLTNTGASAPETEHKKQLGCGSSDLEISGRDILVTLKPGESTREEIEITELYNLTEPGKYTIRVDRTFAGIGHFSSNVVTVNVAP